MSRTPPLFGRAEEAAALQSLLDAVVGRRGHMAVVEGAAGIGKTRLLDEALRHAEALGFLVVRGEADALDQGRPFRPLAQALDLDPANGDPRRAEIGRLLVAGVEQGVSRLASVQPIDLSFRIIDAIVGLVEELCAEAPVVVALEDLHWADASTLRAVRSLARRLAPSPLALLVSLRPTPSTPDVGRAVEDLLDRGARHLVLEPLDEDAAVGLARHLVSAEVGPRLREQLAAAGGSPLFVIELVGALGQEGGLRVHDGCAEVESLSLPPSLRLTIVRRLTFLPADTLELLKLAAVLGSTFSLADLAAVTRRSVVELLPVLEEAVRAGLVSEADGRLAFRHALIREAVYEELPRPIRQDLHRDAGRALAAAGAPATQVAEQLAVGARPGDVEAVDWLRRAAQDAAARSAPVAVRLLERALELTDRHHPQRAAVLAELATPLLTVGRLADAEAMVREALSLKHEPPMSAALEWALAIVIFLSGDRAGARDRLASLAGSAALSDEEAAMSHGLAALASVYVDLRGVRAFAESGAKASERVGSEFGAALALMSSAAVARLEGFAREAVASGRQAVEHASRVGTPWVGVFVHPTFFLGGAYFEADRLEDAEQAWRDGRAITERFGSWHTPWYQMYLGAKHFAAGEWDNAIAEARAGLSLVDEMEFTPFAAFLFPQGLLAAIALQRGDLAQAAAAMAAADEELARSGPQPGLDLMLWAKALLLEAHGDAAQARAMLAGAWGLYSAFGYQVAHRWVATDFVRMAVAAGEHAQAETVVATLETLAERAGAPTAEGAALRCRGLLTADTDALVAAVEAYRKGPRPFDRALACEDAAVALARAGRSEGAREFFDEASAVYEALGALRPVARIEAALRAFGVRRGRRGPRRRAVSGWDSLTPTELQVAGLVAEGLSNRAIGERMFISPRTVDTHVAHLFRKLEVSSRTELAAHALKRLG